MEGFLTFRRMITPALIQVVFWLGAIAVVVYGVTIAGERPVLGILVIVGGVLLVRIWCELLILFFRIHETLISIRATLGETRPLGGVSTHSEGRAPIIPLRGARQDVQEEAECRIELRERGGALEFQAVAHGPNGEHVVATAPCPLRDFAHAARDEQQTALRLLLIRLNRAGWERLPDDDVRGLPQFCRRMT